MNKEIFVANHKQDLLGLQEIKAKFKMIAGSVIQDVYNLLQSTQAVEGILSLAFPRQYEKSASAMKQVIPQRGQKQESANFAWEQV